jgi:hypothetical protein
MQVKICAAVLGMLMLTGGAAAAQDAQVGALQQACKAEFAGVCKDNADKGGFRCLADNKDKLSPDCATALSAAQERRKVFRAACQADTDKLCAGMKGREMMGCLKGKTADLSKPCADAIAAMPGPVAQ